MRTPSAAVQLSMNIEPHPALRWREDGGYFASSVKATLDVVVPGNLQPGDYVELAVIDPATGDILGRTLAEVDDVTFKPIRDQERVVGTERVHKVKPRSHRVRYVDGVVEAVQPNGEPFPPIDEDIR